MSESQLEGKSLQERMDLNPFLREIILEGNRGRSIVDVALSLVHEERQPIGIRKSLFAASSILGVERDWVDAELVDQARRGNEDALLLLKAKRVGR